MTKGTKGAKGNHRTKRTRTAVTKPTGLAKKNLPKELVQPIYEPIPNQSLGGLLRLGEDGLRAARITETRARKLRLLLQHYQIDTDQPDGWSTLAIRLALDFLTGFAVVDAKPPAHGRPLYSSKFDNAALANDVEELALRKSITASQACTKLNKARKYQWYGQGGRALYARYRRYLQHGSEKEPETRIAQLRDQLLDAQSRAHEPESASPIDSWRLTLEEPVRRILDNPDGTKTR